MRTRVPGPVGLTESKSLTEIWFRLKRPKVDQALKKIYRELSPGKPLYKCQTALGTEWLGLLLGLYIMMRQFLISVAFWHKSLVGLHGTYIVLAGL